MLAPVLALLALAAPAPSPSPSPAEGKRVYTNEDLEKARSKPASVVTVPGAQAAPVGDLESSSSDGMGAEERGWRDRAAAARKRIKDAEKRISDAEARFNAALNDLAPNNVLDPNRMQNLEAERARAKTDLEAGKVELEEAKKALAKLDEEARRANVPAGWLRER
jgi:chromosome segregation ATPase